MGNPDMAFSLGFFESLVVLLRGVDVGVVQEETDEFQTAIAGSEVQTRVGVLGRIDAGVGQEEGENLRAVSQTHPHDDLTGADGWIDSGVVEEETDEFQMAIPRSREEDVVGPCRGIDALVGEEGGSERIVSCFDHFRKGTGGCRGLYTRVSEKEGQDVPMAPCRSDDHSVAEIGRRIDPMIGQEDLDDVCIPLGRRLAERIVVFRTRVDAGMVEEDPDDIHMAKLCCQPEGKTVFSPRINTRITQEQLDHFRMAILCSLLDGPVVSVSRIHVRVSQQCSDQIHTSLCTGRCQNRHSAGVKHHRLHLLGDIAIPPRHCHACSTPPLGLDAKVDPRERSVLVNVIRVGLSGRPQDLGVHCVRCQRKAERRVRVESCAECYLLHQLGRKVLHSGPSKPGPRAVLRMYDTYEGGSGKVDDDDEMMTNGIIWNGRPTHHRHHALIT